MIIKNNIFLVILLTFSVLLFSACSKETKIVTPKVNNEKLNIMVSILPQVEFVERIGGDKVVVSEMIPPGFSPATYEPTPGQLKKLQNAEIYFRIGHIPFEKAQMEKLMQINNNMKVVDTSNDIELLSLTGHSHSHSDEIIHDKHEDEHINEEAGEDPHIWLSPKLVKIQAKHIFEALVAASVEDKEYFQANYDKFIKDLSELDEKLTVTFEPIKDKIILVFHPAFGYLADAYGFKQEAIEIEGKDPTPESLKNIIDEAVSDDIKVIFVQKQFSIKSAEAVAKEINGAVVQIDPLAKEYINNLDKMSETIVNKLK